MSSLASLLLFFLAIPADQQTSSNTITEAQAMKVFDLLLSNPTSEDAKTAAQILWKYSEDTPDHEVVVSPKFMPWTGKSKPSDDDVILMGAFFGGDIKEQVKKRTSKAETYAGLLAMIEVYKKLQASKSGYHCEQVDHFIELEKQGKLRAYAEEKDH